MVRYGEEARGAILASACPGVGSKRSDAGGLLRGTRAEYQVVLSLAPQARRGGTTGVAECAADPGAGQRWDAGNKWHGTVAQSGRLAGLELPGGDVSWLAELLRQLP